MVVASSDEFEGEINEEVQKDADEQYRFSFDLFNV
jgi:hypothetical protein